VREVTWGTPSRATRYQRPARRGLVAVAALLAALLAGSLLAAHAVGARAALEPGALSSAHAPMAGACSECHAERRGVASARCERCHDAAGARNLGHAAHVLASPSKDEQERAVAELPCDDCHKEHEGRAARAAAVSSFQCAQCHFRSFAVHPEFGVVRERRGERPGLRFDHAAHIEALGETGGARGSASCARCHEPSPENRDFLPVSFARHCAECHAQDGSLGACKDVDAALVSPPERPAPAAAPEFVVDKGRIGKMRVAHRDAWVLSNWHALRRRVDPEGYAAESAALEARLSRLRGRLARIGQAEPGGQPPPAMQTLGARQQLEGAVAQLAAQLELLAGAKPPPDAPASAAEARAARAALDALAEPCRSCHVPDAAGAFVPVRAAQRVLQGASFVHAPHLLYAECARCHPAVGQSKAAEELHLEGISTCRTCHAADGVREDCQNCHRYHPKAAW
jgi:hypothetical protein